MTRVLVPILPVLLAHPFEFAALATALYSGLSAMQWA
jgi:hypothetical protein